MLWLGMAPWQLPRRHPMKKQIKKLELARETVGKLNLNELTMAAGEGETPNSGSVFVVCFTSLRC